jgi:putative phosphoribosyl transferase
MFSDRRDAGLTLAKELDGLENTPETLVIGIARGGVIIAAALATALSLPMTTIVVKKLKSPKDPELALGALTHNGIKVIDWSHTLKTGVEQIYFDQELQIAADVVRTREDQYENLQLLTDAKFSTFIITDDGVATGATLKAAIKFIEESCGHRGVVPTIVVAVPVISLQAYRDISHMVDAVIAIEVPEDFRSVSTYYQLFPQVQDDEVIAALGRKENL